MEYRHVNLKSRARIFKPSSRAALLVAARYGYRRSLMNDRAAVDSARSGGGRNEPYDAEVAASDGSRDELSGGEPDDGDATVPVVRSRSGDVGAVTPNEEPGTGRSTELKRDVILAIDIGGTKFAAGLVTARGELIDRARVEVERDVVPEAHFSSLATMVAGLIERAKLQHGARIRAVGVGAAGPVERNLEAISPINIPAWRDFPLRARLQEVTRLPVFGDLDAKALALAEGWLGAAQGHANFCALTVSTGVGGGVVLDGELLDGSTGNAGHIGHVIVEPGGRRCGCGAQGCLEAEASGLAIEAITGRPPTEPTYEIMQRTGRLVGVAAASVCNALDLSLVVVGGSVALGFAATFFHSAQVAMDEHSKLPYSIGARITPSRLADSGPLIGAGAVGWRGVRRSRRGEI
jgi:glucokinase